MFPHKFAFDIKEGTITLLNIHVLFDVPPYRTPRFRLGQIVLLNIHVRPDVPTPPAAAARYGVPRHPAEHPCSFRCSHADAKLQSFREYIPAKHPRSFRCSHAQDFAIGGAYAGALLNIHARFDVLAWTLKKPPVSGKTLQNTPRFGAHCNPTTRR